VRRRGLLKVHFSRADLPVLNWKAVPPPYPLCFQPIGRLEKRPLRRFGQGSPRSVSVFHVVIADLCGRRV
jgi:hypothetical protein